MGKVQGLRNLSRVFSPAMFHKIVREDDFVPFQKQVNKYFDAASCGTNLDVIKSLYKLLEKEYRCEYIYKNNLVLKLIKEDRFKAGTIINELKIGASKADLVMLTDVAQAFEIKTELDDFTKLSKQLNDYQKFADGVSIITDESNVGKLKVKYDNTDIGIVVLDVNNKLQTIKEVNKNTSLFDFNTIFKILRKQEYLNLVVDNFGFIPNVPNTQIFRACYELLASKDIVDFQKQVLRKLNERVSTRLDCPDLSTIPKELKHICVSLDFNEREFHKLHKFLST